MVVQREGVAVNGIILVEEAVLLGESRVVAAEVAGVGMVAEGEDRTSVGLANLASQPLADLADWQLFHARTPAPSCHQILLGSKLR